MTTGQIVEIMTSKAAREIKNLEVSIQTAGSICSGFSALLTLMHMKKEITTKTYDYCLDILSQALTERG